MMHGESQPGTRYAGYPALFVYHAGVNDAWCCCCTRCMGLPSSSCSTIHVHVLCTGVFVFFSIDIFCDRHAGCISSCCRIAMRIASEATTPLQPKKVTKCSPFKPNSVYYVHAYHYCCIRPYTSKSRNCWIWHQTFLPFARKCKDRLSFKLKYWRLSYLPPQRCVSSCGLDGRVQ